MSENNKNIMPNHSRIKYSKKQLFRITNSYSKSNQKEKEYLFKHTDFLVIIINWAAMLSKLYQTVTEIIRRILKSVE